MDEEPPDAKCWWCRYKFQSRLHLRKYCPEWKEKQKALWKDVKKETGRGRNRFTIRELFADERCSRMILDFLYTTGAGRRAPDPDEEDVQSEASEWEMRERGEGNR